MKVVLASSSPRRAEILRNAGIAFEICVPDLDESRLGAETPAAMVQRLSKAKCIAVAERIKQSARATPQEAAFVIGADTAVELDGALLGKPRDAGELSEMISRLSGRTHRVLTGLYLLRVPGGEAWSAVETTAVTFARLDAGELAAYVAAGIVDREPFDKAGGYAIQGRAGRYVTRIEGCYFNVVGLPLARLHELLRAASPR